MGQNHIQQPTRAYLWGLLYLALVTVLTIGFPAALILGRLGIDPPVNRPLNYVKARYNAASRQ